MGTPSEQGKGIYPAPAVTFVFDQQGGKVTSFSEDAAEFLGFAQGECLAGKDVQQVPQQRDAFSNEQSQLIGETFMGRKPFASVCMVFGTELLDQNSTITNAYLPIVARFARQANGSSWLDVIYLDVTETAKLGADGVIRCRLGRPGR